MSSGCAARTCDSWPYPGRTFWPSLLALGLVACTSGRPGSAEDDPAGRLDRALSPAAFVELLRKLGGAKVESVSRFGAGPADGVEDHVTTTSHLAIEQGGNFRIVENSDRDGGREIVRLGRDLYVALRHGRMIRRRAEDPEPERLLREAAGWSFAAWEVVRGSVEIQSLPIAVVGGRKAAGFRLGRSARPRVATSEPPLRKWRETVLADKIDGEVRLDEMTGAPLHVQIRASYALTRDGKPMRGAVDVRSDVSAIGSPGLVQAPSAGDLPRRQRTILEERALLSPAAVPSRANQ